MVVEQRGIDVVVTLFGPDGKQIVEVDSPNGAEGPEPVFAVADAAGNYRLVVRSLEKDAKPGRYEVKVVDVRVATEQDRHRLAAQKIAAEASDILHNLGAVYMNLGQPDKSTVPGAVATGHLVGRPLRRSARSLPLPVPYRRGCESSGMAGSARRWRLAPHTWPRKKILRRCDKKPRCRDL